MRTFLTLGGFVYVLCFGGCSPTKLLQSDLDAGSSSGGRNAGNSGTGGVSATGGVSNVEIGGSAGSTSVGGSGAVGGSGGSNSSVGGAATNGGTAAGDLPNTVEAKALCGTPGDVVTIPDLATFLSYVLGRWTYCSGAYVNGIRHDGIEITADGQWYYLYSDGIGGLVRGKGFDGGGTWEVLADNNFQFNIALAGGGGNYLFIAFEINPLGMRFNWMGGVADYIGTGVNAVTSGDAGTSDSGSAAPDAGSNDAGATDPGHSDGGFNGPA